MCRDYDVAVNFDRPVDEHHGSWLLAKLPSVAPAPPLHRVESLFLILGVTGVTQPDGEVGKSCRSGGWTSKGLGLRPFARLIDGLRPCLVGVNYTGSLSIA